MRLNAGWTYDAGFINQPNLYVLTPAGAPIAAQPGNLLSPPVTYSKDGTNDYHYRSARISALWKPSDEFHAQLSYYYQLLHAPAGFPMASPLYTAIGSHSVFARTTRRGDCRRRWSNVRCARRIEAMTWDLRP